MPATFRPYDLDQRMLLPPSLRDWLPAGHLAEHVSDLLDSLGLSASCRVTRGRVPEVDEGASIDAKVLIYGYATAVYSSRSLARQL